ncbi:MAG: competence protein CoiA [Streptococcaceae bacterium]|jgi:competence protein CoiA|nr:competence protein CoiA [Streptococcaceae bacterium]
MLVAMNEQGKVINLLEMDDSERSVLARQALVCPACKSQVRLKNGRVKAPHFAHISLKACRHQAENESYQHLALKTALYQWFAQTETVQIEHFLPALQQTPDLLVNGTLAIEIQCSHLSIQRLRERTKAYQTHGYPVVWLMGKDLWLGSKLSALKQDLLYFSQNAGFYYWELDLSCRKIRLRYLIHEDLTGKLHYLTRDFAFGSANLLTILRCPFKPITAKLAVHLPNDLTTFIARQLYYQNPKWLKIQALYYQNGQNLLTLTSIPLPIAPLGLNPLLASFQAPQSPDFCQVTRDISDYYRQFLVYHVQKTADILYPPSLYRQMLDPR